MESEPRFQLEERIAFAACEAQPQTEARAGVQAHLAALTTGLTLPVGVQPPPEPTGVRVAVRDVLAVATGGALGAVLRFALLRRAQGRPQRASG